MQQYTAMVRMPLRLGGDGVIRVSDTRVRFEAILFAFAEGRSVEAIAEQYPSIPMADLYQVIGYYLGNSEDVDAYIRGLTGKARGLEAGDEADQQFCLH